MRHGPGIVFDSTSVDGNSRLSNKGHDLRSCNEFINMIKLFGS